MTRVATAEFHVDPSTKAGIYKTTAAVKLAEGSGTSDISVGEVEISPDAPLAEGPRMPQPQPTVNEVLADYPNLTIVASRKTSVPWEGYILVDLRGTYGP
jgi:hypothetical protein